MDADLLKRLTDRLTEWRAEALELHLHSFDDQAIGLEACARDLEVDLRSIGK